MNATLCTFGQFLTNLDMMFLTVSSRMLGNRGWATESGSRQILSSSLSERPWNADLQKEPFRVTRREFSYNGRSGLHVLDIDTDGRVGDQIRALVVKTIFQRSYLVQLAAVADRFAVE